MYSREKTDLIEYDDIPNLSMYIVTEDENRKRTPDDWIAPGPDLDEASDFSGYIGLQEYTNIDCTVYRGAYIKVNEKGTEADAATTEVCMLG